MSEEKERKERVNVPDEEFFPKYKAAFDSGVKLSDFAVEIGQAEGTITGRIAKYNKMCKDYAETYKQMGVEMPKLGYLKTGNETGTKGRKKLSLSEWATLMGNTINSPV